MIYVHNHSYIIINVWHVELMAIFVLSLKRIYNYDEMYKSTSAVLQFIRYKPYNLKGLIESQFYGCDTSS